MALRSLGGGAIFADVAGRGLPLTVGLHGWGRVRSDMAPVLDGLPGTTASLDLPGFGTSPPPPEAWGAADYARVIGLAVDELLADLAETGDVGDAADADTDADAGSADDALPEERPRSGNGAGVAGAQRSRAASQAVFVGHSMGGRVSLCLAAQRPDLVGGLVLAGVPQLLRAPSAGKPKLAFRVARRLHRWRLLPDARMEALRQRYGSADYRAAQGVMRQVLVRLVGESYEQQLSQIECPVDMVWGELDTAAPVDLARRAVELIPARHSLEVVAGVDHDVHTARPQLLRERARAQGEELRP
jgi:pimeloyl-ACP methyl ester carboxylesterase